MQIWFNRQGEPITMEEANAALLDAEQRVVKKTNLDNGQQVSTVWLGVSLNFYVPIPPKNPFDEPELYPRNLFETMIFGKGPFENEATKWDTEQQAIQGHEAWVRMIKEAIGDEQEKPDA